MDFMNQLQCRCFVLLLLFSVPGLCLLSNTIIPESKYRIRCYYEIIIQLSCRPTIPPPPPNNKKTHTSLSLTAVPLPRQPRTTYYSTTHNYIIPLQSPYINVYLPLPSPSSPTPAPRNPIPTSRVVLYSQTSQSSARPYPVTQPANQPTNHPLHSSHPPFPETLTTSLGPS